MSADQFVIRGNNGTERTADTRSEAEDIKAEAEDLGLDAEIIPPGGDDPQPVEATPVKPDPAPEPDTADEAADLPERSITDDPLTWIPGDFVDTIDGSQAINRKGFEVLAHFYDVDVASEVVVPPEDTDHEYARVKAVATTADGRTCEAHGSAHVDRDDDHFLLLEMADTRARKRALSIATGVGAVAVSELKNEVQE